MLEKKLIRFSSLNVVQSKNKSLTTTVLRILTIAKYNRNLLVLKTVTV